VSPRPGRRIGRTRLTLPQVQARHRAIAKLEAARCSCPGGPDIQFHRYWCIVAGPLELPGHHLQRAAAENA
jgi:hypothetical protein